MTLTDTSHSPLEGPRIRLGISACLLGQRVRYDGGHKFDPFLLNELGRYVEWVPVCPEVETGLPVPRESMHLAGDPDHPCLVARSGIDYTERMRAWAQERAQQLSDARLHGFVFKKDSPSSGLFRVLVYDEHGIGQRVGIGMFARAVRERFPLLPLEEEGRLGDARLRENFIERVFAYSRWMTVLEENLMPGGLVEFHTAHKLTVMAHSPRHYREMGQLVAQAGDLPSVELAQAYSQMLMAGLSVLATPGKHANVLQHLMGFLKRSLSQEDKVELLGLIDDYRRGLLPLIIPLTLLKHHLWRFPVPDWIGKQVYLNPYPKELMLRNRV